MNGIILLLVALTGIEFHYFGFHCIDVLFIALIGCSLHSSAIVWWLVFFKNEYLPQKFSRCPSSDVSSQMVPPGAPKWIRRWSQEIQDDPRRSQVSRDGQRSQMIADDPTSSQMLPNEFHMNPNDSKWFQMIPHIPKSFQVPFQLVQISGRMVGLVNRIITWMSK